MRLTLVLIFFFPALSQAQIFDQDVIGTSGDSYSNTSVTIGWTVGEVAIEYYGGTSNDITEGFWNPLIGPGSIDEYGNQYLIETYPNPAFDVVNFNIPQELGTVEIQVMNSLGQIVLTTTSEASTSASIDVSSLATGIYIVSFIGDSGVIESQKIQKL